jgi:hypothetical protein
MEALVSEVGEWEGDCQYNSQLALLNKEALDEAGKDTLRVNYTGIHFKPYSHMWSCISNTLHEAGLEKKEIC